MVEQRKQATSVRLGAGDLSNLKRLAKRLGVRDSDIVRFAIKSMLGRVLPLCDERIVGRQLVPVLIDAGDELIRHFDLDSYRLESIINERAAESARVERDDIALLAMSVLRKQYLMNRVKDGHSAADASAAAQSLSDYLYDKYVSRADPRAADPRAADPHAADFQSPNAENPSSRQRPAA